MNHVLMSLDPLTQEVDLAQDENGFISLSAGLETMCLISLFTRRRAPNDAKRDPRFGWWGDSLAEVVGDEIGSWLWLLQRANLTTETLRLGTYYGEQCFMWMKEDELAKKVKVSTEKLDNALGIRVEITRPDGEQWSNIWKVHTNAL